MNYKAKDTLTAIEMCRDEKIEFELARNRLEEIKIFSVN